MLDWQYPGKANEARRAQEKQSEVLLQMCSHTANGFKHFKVEAARHRSVTNSKVEGGAFDPSAFQNDAFDVGRFVVDLDGDAAVKYGPDIEVTDLAEKMLSFWKSKIGP